MMESLHDAGLDFAAIQEYGIIFEFLEIVQLGHLLIRSIPSELFQGVLAVVADVLLEAESLYSCHRELFCAEAEDVLELQLHWL